MSDRRAIVLLVVCACLGALARYVGLEGYTPYILGVAIIGGFLYLGFKIDDLHSDLTAVRRDVDDLQEARKRDLEDRHH
jgi:Kef-type K+ transport system membrane component KefB